MNRKVLDKIASEMGYKTWEEMMEKAYLSQVKPERMVEIVKKYTKKDVELAEVEKYLKR